MSFIVVLDGRTLSDNEHDGAQGATITYRQSDGQDSAFSLSSEITFFGTAASQIKAAIIDSASPLSSRLSVVVKDDCCDDLLFEGLITFETVSWYEYEAGSSVKCVVSASIKDGSQESAYLACLKNTVISSTTSVDGLRSSLGPDEYRQSLYLGFCTEARPKSFQLTMFYIAALVTNALISVTSFLGLFIRAYRQVLNNIQNAIMGCGKLVKAPFVHSYLSNICTLCGLGLDSPIFGQGGFLHNLTRTDIPFKVSAGTQSEANTDYWRFNRPSLTATEFLDSFKAFNIDWTLDGARLIVDRKDRISPNLLADLSNRVGDIISINYSANNSAKLWAGRFYRWPDDQSDKVANQLVNEFSFLKNYNVPFNPDMRGVNTVTFEYAFWIYNDMNGVESAYNTFASVVPSFLYNLYGVPTHTLIAQTETRSYPILGLWTGQGAELNQIPLKTIDLNDPTFQVPYTIGGVTFPPNAPSPNLYSELLYIDDTRLNAAKYTAFEAVFTYNCQDIANIRAKSIILPKNGSTATGFIDEVVINPNDRTITVTGKI